MDTPHPIQPQCFACWQTRNKDRRIPVRVRDQFRSEERCCHCGCLTNDGIFVAYNPKDCTFPRMRPIK